MSELERVLDIQVLDSALDQLPHRLDRLAERAAHRDALAVLRAAQDRLDDATKRIDTATVGIDRLEALGHDRATKKARFELQLKTVIASREAEALMGEIARLDEQRSAADDVELELLDDVERATADREAALAEIAAADAVLATATTELAAAEAALEIERAELATARAAAAAAVSESSLSQYERLRKSYGGVAISRLAAGRCGACHLDQSRAALDALRAAPEDAMHECEQCGRLLVR